MTGLITAYQNITTNQTRSLQQISSQPAAAREIAYFKAHIASVKSIDDFVGNTRLLNFALQAYGLKDMAFAKAFIKKALSEGVSSRNAFAMKLSDQRFRQFVSAFNFAALGNATTASVNLQKTTVAKYSESLLEEQAGTQSEGLRLALNFRAKISTVTSVFGILGDAALYQVVRTTLGLPQALSAIDIDKQAALINGKFNLADMKDPAKSDKFVTRFLAMYDMQNGDAVQSSPAVAVGAGSTGGVDVGTLLALQSIKRFGA